MKEVATCYSPGFITDKHDVIGIFTDGLDGISVTEINTIMRLCRSD